MQEIRSIQDGLNKDIEKLTKKLNDLEVERKDVSARITNMKIQIRSLQIKKKNIMNLNSGEEERFKLIFEK